MAVRCPTGSANFFEYFCPPPSDLTYRTMTLMADVANQTLAGRPELITRIRTERALQDPVGMGLGWAEETLPDQITTALGLGQRVADEALVNAGVCYPDTPEQPRPASSRFRLYRHRLLLPDWRRGKHGTGVVFYQGRAVVETAVKYLSPPGIPKPLFGLDSLARPTGIVWLGEGPFDILPLIEAGESAVATMGSTLKQRLIADLIVAVGDREIIIAFDRDASGQTQAPVLADTLTNAGARTRIIFPPPPYTDMGEWLVAEGVHDVIADIRW